MYEYNPDLDKWFTWPGPDFARKSFALVAANNGLYAFGGTNGTTTTNTVEFVPFSELTSIENEYLHMGEEDWIDPTGNFSRTFVDMSYTVPGFNVNISRTYNSQDYRPSPFCTGWTFGFQGKVSAEGNNMMVRLPDGSGHSFKPESNGTYTAKDSHSILVKNGDNTYTLTTADQYKYGFDNVGYLTYMEDKNGNRITITVDANGKISRITDPVGGIITVNYDSANRIVSIVDPLGRAVIYTYGIRGEYSYITLDKVTDPTGSVTNYNYTPMRPNANYQWINYLSEVRDNANALLEKMEYTPITLEKPLPMLTAITDANGKREAYTYNSDAGTVAITDNGGRTTTIWYDKMLYPIRTRDAEGGDTLTEYGLGGGANRFGEVKRQTDRNGNSTNYDWDSHGNVTCVVNPDGNYQKYTYDAKNNLLSEKDALGGATYYVYDASGNLAKKARRLSGTEDYSDWADQSNFAITVYSYGYRGLLYWEMDSERVTTEYIYDDYGNLSASRKYTSDVTYNATTYQNNRLGWLMWEKTPSGQQTSYYYDKNGRLLKKIMPDGGIERYVYDAMGNLSQKITPNQYAYWVDSATFDSANILNNGGAYAQTDHGYRYQYTPSGLVWQETDPLGYQSQYAYDIYGNRGSETKANGAVYTYFYDKLDRLYATEYKPSADAGFVTTETWSYGISSGKTTTTETKYLTAVTTTAVTKTTYDYAGRVVKQENPDGGILEKTYNANGTMKQSKDALGNITSYQYDALGRLIKQWTPAEGGKYSYLGLKYDKSDRVTYQYRGVDLVASGTDAANLVWSRNEYDRDGTITRKSNSQGGRTDYTYDTDGHLTQEKQYATGSAYNKVDYTYDPMGRILDKRLAADKEDIDPFRLSRVFLLEESYYLTITENNFPNKISYIPASSDPQLHIRTEEIRESEVILTLKITANEDSAGQIFWRTLDSIYTEEKSKWFNVKSGTQEYTVNLGALSLDYVRIDAGAQDSTITISDIQLKFSSDLTTSYAYDKQGNLLTQVDANGIATTYTYDLLNRQLSATQPGENENGELVNITSNKTYDWAGNLLTEQDPNGGTTNYTYDARGLLTMVNNPLGGITAYEYDLAGRKIKEISPQNYAADQANRTEFAYDSMGRLSKQMDYFNDSSISNSYSYDKNGNLLSKTDGLGYVTGYTYTESNQLATVLDPVSADRGLEFSSKSEYDGLGRKIKETNAEGMVSQYSYDDLGNLLSTKLSDRTLETNTYDFLGNLLTKKDANGNTTTFTYNALNQVRQATLPSDDNIPSYSITYKYDKLGRQVEALDSIGKKTATSYDNQGRQLSQTESKNDGSQAITVSKRYDKNGNLRFLVDGNGNETECVYDALNRKIQDKAKVTVNGELTTKATSYDYDANGNIISATDWLGNKAENIYDPLNRLIQRKDASGTVIETLTYNANHQQTKSTDALGYDTDFTYNKNNQLLKKTTYLDADHPIVEQQTYDNLGRVAGKIDGKGNTTRYSYNDYGNLEWVKDALDNYTYFEYDFNGNLLSQSNMTGHQTQFAYNARNLPQSKTDALGHDEIYNYYAGGALSSKIDRNGVQCGYTYDIHDRLLLEYKGGVSIWHSYDNNSNELTLTDSTGITTRDYDELNRVITKTVPDIGMTFFTYDETGGLTAGFHRETTTDPHGNITKKVMDKNGRLSQVLDGNSPVATYTYLDNGNREKVSYASGVVEEYTYNENNQIKTLANKNAGGSTIEAFNYGYDAAGNMVNKLDKKGITSYTYDENNRLAAVTEPDGKVTNYTFDQAGNRATETAKIDSDTTITSYSYDENNRLVQTEKEKNGMAIGSDDYTYDPNGNMIARISLSGNEENTGSDTFLSIVGEDEDSSDVTLYSYDVYNNLTEVLEGANRVEMKYNGAGQRVEKYTNNSTTRYLYEYDKVILEEDENGEQTGRNIYGLNLLRRQESEASLDYLYNGHGDVTNLMNGAAIAANYYYDAFGNITEDDNNYSNPYRYAGYQWDVESKLYYINSRHYNPTLARFLQEDTYRGTAGDPLSLNLYAYCSNNPIRYWDPTGHASEFQVVRDDGAVWSTFAGGYVGSDGTVVSKTPEYKETGSSSSGGSSNNPPSNNTSNNNTGGGSGGSSSSSKLPSLSDPLVIYVANKNGVDLNTAQSMVISDQKWGTNNYGTYDGGSGSLSDMGKNPPNGTLTNIYIPSTINPGTYIESTGYIIGGYTYYSDGITRISEGTVVQTAGGYYKLVRTEDGNLEGMLTGKPSNVFDTSY
ncbi:MAG: DUF6531 domain-containing protein, partial [Clostridiales bacterium]|nr:DUF6531 domain-containing protein [Clostridiales bacterium]